MELMKAWLVERQAAHKYFVALVDFQDNYAENMVLADGLPMYLLWRIQNWCNRNQELECFDKYHTEPDGWRFLEAICHRALCVIS